MKKFKIDPKKVVAAYKRKGLLARAAMFHPIKGQEACCALGALARPSEGDVSDVMRRLGVDGDFYAGFDCILRGETPFENNSTFLNGVAVAEAVIEAGLVLPSQLTRL